MKTLADARAELFKDLATGTKCPCCDQLAREWARKLNSSMARSLIWLVKAAGDEMLWVDVPREGPLWLHKSRELPKLAYWGLIEQLENTEEYKKSSGVWRPTMDGHKFAMNRMRISKFVYVYNKTIRGFSDETCDVVDALGNKFSYRELMEG
jgi:hypothetical protein